MLAGESKAKEIVVPAQWKTEDMEVLVPYVIASHLLYDLARAREDQTVLILPPIGKIWITVFFHKLWWKSVCYAPNYKGLGTFLVSGFVYVLPCMLCPSSREVQASVLKYFIYGFLMDF